jgi:hypothetical protein
LQLLLKMFSLCPSILCGCFLVTVLGKISVLCLFFIFMSLTVEGRPLGQGSHVRIKGSNTVRVIPRFVPTTPDTVKHSMTNSSYVPPDSPAPFTAGGSQCRRSAAEGSTNGSTLAAQRSANESTSAAQRSANESTGAAPRSQSWPPQPAVTYTALLSASSCGDVTNGGGEGGGGGGRKVGGGGLPIQQPQHKGKCGVANPWTK